MQAGDGFWTDGRASGGGAFVVNTQKYLNVFKSSKTNYIDSKIKNGKNIMKTTWNVTKNEIDKIKDPFQRDLLRGGGVPEEKWGKVENRQGRRGILSGVYILGDRKLKNNEINKGNKKK
ncbi:hypothetical protein EVAR_58498_1 [Eumeta japonica]|uniref:Uncharacterized protein n=1 Tax=Eumeta variegata TaxID=151549 RepID=A0A4C1ZB93_EUMVA|nr:hypothetical protein EVAR_58498_1 [Eumeta japonica]